MQERTVGTALASSSPNNSLFELFVFLHCSHKVSRQDGRHTWSLLSRSFSNLLGILCAPKLHRPCRDKTTNLTEDIYNIYSRKNFDSGYIEGFAKLPYFRSLFIVATSMQSESVRLGSMNLLQTVKSFQDILSFAEIERILVGE